MNTIRIITESGPKMICKSEEMPEISDLHRWYSSMAKYGHTVLTVNGVEHVFRTENVNGFQVHILTPGHAKRLDLHPELLFSEPKTEPELI